MTTLLTLQHYEMLHILECLALHNKNYAIIESKLDEFWNILVSVEDATVLSSVINGRHYISGIHYIDDESLNYLYKYINFKINNELDIL